MSTSTQKKQRYLALLGIPLLSTLIIFALISFADELFQDWENKTLDYRFKLRAEGPVSPEIVMIDINDQSMAALGRWPWHRSLHAEMIDLLSESGAAVIGYDILFNQSASEMEDVRLETAIRKAGNLYLPTGFELSKKDALSPLLSVIREIGPLARFKNAAAGIGHISSNRDPDGTIRQAPLLVNQDGNPFPAFALTLVQGYLQNTQVTPSLSAQNKILLTNKGRQKMTIPVNKSGLMRINYAGPWVSTFSHYSFADILQTWKDEGSRPALRTAFSGKILLISNTATGFDLKPIPLESDYPGGGIHANIINTILTGDYLWEPDVIFNFGLSLFLATLISTLLFYKQDHSALPLGLLLTLLYLALTQLSFQQGFNLPVLFPVLTLILSTLSSLRYQNHHSVQKVVQLTEDKKQASEIFQADLEQLEKAKNHLLKEKQGLVEKNKGLVERVDQFSMAKINKTPALQDNLEALRKEAAVHGLVTQNRSLLESFAQIKKTASTPLSILILGETGTGKECIAKIIHAMNTKTKKRMVTVNMPAISKTLFESAMFGHVKGAFSGAHADQPGKFKEADGSTLFLDEIGEIPPEIQAKLLRAIETGQIDRVGATQPDQVTIKVISATNQALEEQIKKKIFRLDLFQRLTGQIIKIPPLRKRKEDLEDLTHYFLEQLAFKNGGTRKVLSEDARIKIKAYDWPGNVRELKTSIEKAVVLSEKNALISAADLGLGQAGEKASPPLPGEAQIHSELPRTAVVLPEDKYHADRDFLRLLRQNKFNKTRTGKCLDRSTGMVGSRFRGICLKTLNEHQQDLKKAAQALSEPGEDASEMEKFIQEYYSNLIQSIQGFKDSKTAVDRCKTVLFKNIKMTYRTHMIALVENYFDSPD